MQWYIAIFHWVNCRLAIDTFQCWWLLFCVFYIWNHQNVIHWYTRMNAQHIHTYNNTCQIEGDQIIKCMHVCANVLCMCIHVRVHRLFETQFLHQLLTQNYLNITHSLSPIFLFLILHSYYSAMNAQYNQHIIWRSEKEANTIQRNNSLCWIRWLSGHSCIDRTSCFNQ